MGRDASGPYLEIMTDQAVSGLFGPIQNAQAFVIQNSLRSFLIGRDPLANELLLDQMLRLDRHGRSGIFMTGTSPIDCALWDLKGKQFLHNPIYRPNAGFVELPDLPGLGLVIDEDRDEERRPIRFQES